MRILLIVSFFLNIAVANAQKYEAKVKQLEQYGIPFFYNADIEANIEAWKSNVDGNTSEILGRSVAYFREMEVAQKTNGLPWFIKFIPAANTGYNLKYISTDGSSGMWPLNFSISKKYGLVQNSMLDERMSLEASSDAACHYLADLHNIYKDWLKTITAFRIGAIRLNQVIRLASNSLDFNEIYKHLEPAEREPIVQFYAAVTVMYFRHDFGLQEDDIQKQVSDTVSANVSLDFALIAEHTGIISEDLESLNPEFIAGRVPNFGKPMIFRVPTGQAGLYNSKKDTLHLLGSGYVPAPKVEYDTIVKVVDSITYIEVVPKQDSIEKESATPAPAKNTYVWVYYKVKSGDGFYTLSDVFDCTISQMKSWNKIKGNKLIANKNIRFYVPASKASYYKRINGMTQSQKRNLAAKD